MAKYTGPVCRLCRREGTKLYLKGDRCYNVNKDGVVSKMLCPFDKVSTTPDGKRKPILPPGPPKNGRRKVSGYNLQLREKQKAKRIYGILEKQFFRYFEMAEKKRGNTGENMFILIERRLDNVVFRLGLGTSRAQARQIVNHGHVTVNGKKVDIPSYLVSAGDVIAVRESSAEVPMFKAIKELGTKENPPRWLEFDRNTLAGKVLSLPTAEDLDSSIKVHMIVELYSK